MFGFRDIEILKAVVEAGGFRAAAARSGMSQSAMSTRVAALERRLGVVLFDRIGRGVRLSTAGRRLLEESSRLIATRDRIVNELAGSEGLCGTVRMGVAETIVHTLLPALLGTLRREHPAVRFELAVDTSTQLARALTDNEIDVAILLDDAVPTSAQREALPAVTVDWYGAKGKHDNTPLTLAALAQFSIVTYSKGTTPFHQIERLFTTLDTPPLLHGSASLSTVRDLIAADFGIGILPRRMAESNMSRRNDIQRLKVCEAAVPAALDFAVAWRSGTHDDTGAIVAAAALAADQIDAR